MQAFTISDIVVFLSVCWYLFLFYNYSLHLITCILVWSIVIGQGSPYEPYFAGFLFILFTIMYFTQRGPQTVDPVA